MRSYMMPNPPRTTVLPLPLRSVCEAEARTEGGPVIVHQTLGDSALAGDADAVQIERIASENRVRAGAEAWAGGTDRCRWAG